MDDPLHRQSLAGKTLFITGGSRGIGLADLQVKAAAAHAILCRPARSFTGRFVFDDQMLGEAGVTDFEPYRNDPASALLPDLFVDSTAPLPPGARYEAAP